MNASAGEKACPHCSGACSPEHQYCPLCGFPVATLGRQTSDRFVGRTLPGGYHILDLISVGGMGRVYRAEQSALRRTVAVKIIHPHLLTDDNASLRFMTEAQATSRLNHPNSISVFDFGKTEDGQPYLVMEFLRGRDLSYIAFDEGPLEFRRIIDVARQILAALEEAHALGIIHRDLKPENVVLEPMRRGGDFVKVVDFGLAKLKADVPGVTSPGIVCGTPDYMAPEQGRGDPIDGRSDLYAVGVLIFQLLTGRLPFEAETATQVVMMHISVPAPDPRQVAPEREIPEALAEVVNRALLKDAKERYQDAHEFSQALEQVERSLATIPPAFQSSTPPNAEKGSRSACPHCHALVPGGHFCGECGAALSTAPNRNASEAFGGRPLPFVGRDREFEWLEAQRRLTVKTPQCARLCGPPGVGKTRLIEEFLAFANEEGDWIVQAGPDPLGAETACHTLRQLLTRLRALTETNNASDRLRAEESHRAFGLRDIFSAEASSDDQRTPLERREALADALTWALEYALESAAPHRVIVAIDDWHRVDGVSRMAINDMLEAPPSGALLLVTSHVSGTQVPWKNSTELTLELLGRATLLRLLKNLFVPDLPALRQQDSPGLLPLHFEQLLRYLAEGGSSAPEGLADIIALRIDTLAPPARRALQALSVLGDGVSVKSLQALLPGGDDLTQAVAPLVASGMARRSADILSTAHPLVRDVVLAGIPHAVRRELHAKAHAHCESSGAALEVRAQHAFYAQSSFHALLLLEQVADRARPRGDTDAEVLALRRALDLARQEIARGELDDPLRAVLIFGRKLGAALTRAGAFADAEGVLQEALDVAGPSGSDRVSVLAALAQVEHSRGRKLQARSYIDRALSAAQETGDLELSKTLRETFQGWAS